MAESTNTTQSNSSVNVSDKVLHCDTCGKPVTSVARVVIDQEYDRSMSRALYNCPECFKKKEEERHHRLNQAG